MSAISIHVSTEVARCYENASDATKTNAEQFINAWLMHFLNSKNYNQELKGIMKNASHIAEANGLTPDKLEEILKDA